MTVKTYLLKQIDKPVSAIGLGTMIFHPDSKERDFSLLDTFVENGGTYVDTAEVYGAVEEQGYSEMVIGDWLEAHPDKREKIVLASKGLITGYCAALHPGGAKINPESIHRAIDGSLKRLKAEYLDIWMLHRDDLSQPVSSIVDALDEEVKKGRIRSYGASNWTTKRIQEAIDYARAKGKTEMSSSSPHFSLAKANEPFWPDTVVTDQKDKQWFKDHNFPLIAWSSLGRGFFAKGDPNDTSNADLVRVFYSDENFERKARATALATYKKLNMFEMALAYVLNQPFPVIALNGAETPEQVKTSLHAASLTLTQEEVDWLDLTSDNKPF